VKTFKGIRQLERPKKPRHFSKAAMSVELQERLDNIQRKYDFDPSNGWAQLLLNDRVRRKTLLIQQEDIEQAMAYGELRALASFGAMYDLDFRFKRKRDFLIDEIEKKLDEKPPPVQQARYFVNSMPLPDGTIEYRVWDSIELPSKAVRGPFTSAAMADEVCEKLNLRVFGQAGGVF
jgi:hypothetical protein